jgi:hypothetical protein
MRKKLLWMFIGLLGLTLFTTGSALATVSIDYEPYNAALIKFNGTTDTFTFDQFPGGNIKITNAVGNTDPLTIGLQGSLSGTFAIGAITTVGPLQTAPVSSGNGFFTITDQNNVQFKANLVWVDIFTLGTQGGLNAGGSANLTPVSYGGTNTDLLAFFNNGGSTKLSFQFSPAKSLTTLTTELFNGTSFNGSASAVPVPGAFLLMGSGLFGIVGLGLRKKS